MHKKKVFLDIECYRDYFLIYFKSIDKVKYYELTPKSSIDLKEIKYIMESYTTIGYNSLNYDLPMLVFALQGLNTSELKERSDQIIHSTDSHAWETRKRLGIVIPYTWDHIDLIEPSPAPRIKVTKTINDVKVKTYIGVSLKDYGARMHTKVLQELPIPPDALINPKDYKLLRDYCANDVKITMELYNRIEQDIVLREQINQVYDIDVRSKSKAQISETIIKKILNLKYSQRVINTERIYKYNPPAYIRFSNPDIQSYLDSLLRQNFKCNELGYIETEGLDIADKLIVNGNLISVGIGGLHSNERHITHLSDKDTFILDVDVVSYYPKIILNNKYYPAEIGVNFLKVYKDFYDERIKAKKNKDIVKAETFKIILNGVFGKFGSPSSVMYDPSLLLHTTLTGQLSLLMLIGTLVNEEFEVISVNTDGVTIKGRRSQLSFLEVLLESWEETTGFNLEKVFYKAAYYETVGTYLAISDDNRVKGKGVYAPVGLTKSPVTPICIDAIIAYLCYNIPVEKTIRSEKDITKFLVVRKGNKGAMYEGQYLGKVVRWYYSNNPDKHITCRVTGNKIAASDGAVPLMTLPDEPIQDININTYVHKTIKMLKDLGVKYE